MDIGKIEKVVEEPLPLWFPREREPEQTPAPERPTPEKAPEKEEVPA